MWIGDVLVGNLFFGIETTFYMYILLTLRVLSWKFWGLIRKVGPNGKKGELIGSISLLHTCTVYTVYVVPSSICSKPFSQ